MSATTLLNSSNALSRAAQAGGAPAMQLLSPEAAPPFWSVLARQTAESNVFAEPWLSMAGITHCDPRHAAKIALLSDADGQALGLLPLLTTRSLGRLPLPTLATWSHPNSFLTSALASAGNEKAMWAGLLANAVTHFPAARTLLADGLVEGGALHRGLIDAAAALELPAMVEQSTVRAMLATDMDAECYWDSSVRAKKRKELRRQWARLGEEGVLTVEQRDGDGDPSSWIEEFLALEAQGWKGSNGSALASHTETRAFFTQAMSAGWAEGKVLLTALRIDGRAIAMLVTLLSGNAGFSFKTAFDEAFARFSPGVLLQRESLALLTGRKLAFIDSCAAQDHPMIDSLWRERRTVVTLSMPLPGAANRLMWQAAQHAAQVWRKLKSPSRRPSQEPYA